MLPPPVNNQLIFNEIFVTEYKMLSRAISLKE